MNRQELSRRFVVVLRWLARLGSLFSVAFLALFLFGEEMNPGELTAAEILGLLFFPFGVTVGMLLGWRWETLGGVVTVLSVLAFYKAMYAANGRFPEGTWFALFALPGLLFLYCGLHNHNTNHTPRIV